MNGNEIDMRMFAQRIGASVTFSAGSIVFNKGDAGSCMYIVQSGLIEMVVGDKVIEICGANEAIGFMSMVDDAPTSSTARVKETCELFLNPLYLRRGAELRPLHHGGHGAADSRHEPSDVKIRASWSRHHGMGKHSYLPCAAGRAKAGAIKLATR